MQRCALLAVWLTIAGGCGRSTAVGPYAAPSPLPDAPRAVLALGATTPVLAFAGQPQTFDASASTGEDLTYQIEFGDGQVTSKPVAVHAIARASRLTARLTVRDRFGRGDTVSVPYLLMGLDEPLFWFHNERAGNTTIQRRFFLRQSESGVSGSYSGPEGSGLRLTGKLSGERDVRLVSEDGAIEWMGAIEWRTDRDWGLSAAGVALRLRVTRGATEGAVFDFHYADPY